MKTRIIIAGLATAGMLLGASSAFAQSTVTGTLSAGGNGSSSLSGNVTNNSSSTLTGTVTGGTTTTGGGGGGGGGGSGSNITDICPNLAGTQASLPAGYVIQNGNCVLGSTGGTGTTGGTTGGTGGGVLGTSTGPNVPNTGEGGDAAAALVMLGVSAAAILGGMRLMKQRAA